eukprot:SAG31_NODE_11467_length_1027_cov_0.992457_1_plen_310_part_01
MNASILRGDSRVQEQLGLQGRPVSLPELLVGSEMRPHMSLLKAKTPSRRHRRRREKPRLPQKSGRGVHFALDASERVASSSVLSPPEEEGLATRKVMSSSDAAPRTVPASAIPHATTRPDLGSQAIGTTERPAIRPGSAGDAVDKSLSAMGGHIRQLRRTAQCVAAADTAISTNGRAARTDAGEEDRAAVLALREQLAALSKLYTELAQSRANELGQKTQKLRHLQAARAEEQRSHAAQLDELSDKTNKLRYELHETRKQALAASAHGLDDGKDAHHWRHEAASKEAEMVTLRQRNEELEKALAAMDAQL